jgi:hypothetical protein
MTEIEKQTVSAVPPAEHFVSGVDNLIQIENSRCQPNEGAPTD